MSRNGCISYGSCSQINFVMPTGLPSGAATVTLLRNGAPPCTSRIDVAPTAPGIFSAWSQLLRVRADGTSSVESAASPIAMNGDTVYLVLYGTRIRNGQSGAIVNGQTLPVAYSGTQSELAGLDQLDVLLPAALRGAGQVGVTLLVDGQRSNSVTPMFQ